MELDLDFHSILMTRIFFPAKIQSKIILQKIIPQGSKIRGDYLGDYNFLHYGAAVLVL